MAEPTIRPTGEEAGSTWTAIGAEAKWKELAQEAVDPAAANTAKGAAAAVIGAKLELKLTIPKLAEGEKVIGLVVHLYAKGSNAGGKNVNMSISGGTFVGKNTEVWGGNAVEAWSTLSPWTKAELEEKATSELPLLVTFNSLRAASQKAYELYIVVTTETAGGGQQTMIV